MLCYLQLQDSPRTWFAALNLGRLLLLLQRLLQLHWTAMGLVEALAMCLLACCSTSSSSCTIPSATVGMQHRQPLLELSWQHLQEAGKLASATALPVCEILCWLQRQHAQHWLGAASSLLAASLLQQQVGLTSGPSGRAMKA